MSKALTIPLTLKFGILSRVNSGWYRIAMTSLLFLASKLKDVSTLSHDSAFGLLYGTRHPRISVGFRQKRFKLAMIKSVRWNEVHIRHHNLQNVSKLQSFSSKWLL